MDNAKSGSICYMYIYMYICIYICIYVCMYGLYVCPLNGFLDLTPVYSETAALSKLYFIL